MHFNHMIYTENSRNINFTEISCIYFFIFFFFLLYMLIIPLRKRNTVTQKIYIRIHITDNIFFDVIQCNGLY